MEYAGYGDHSEARAKIVENQQKKERSFATRMGLGFKKDTNTNTNTNLGKGSNDGKGL